MSTVIEDVKGAERDVTGAERDVEGAEVVPLTVEARLARAETMVRTYSAWAAAGGVIPVPVIDAAAIVTVQLRMLERLAHLYGVTFKSDFVKHLIGSVVASAVPLDVAKGTAVSLSGIIKFVPVLGPLFGIGLLPAFAAASTYALGRIFITHFESGGTFLNFDPAKARAAFREEVSRNKAEPKIIPHSTPVPVA